MNLIDRYVNEIGRRLPRRQRAEVRQELRSSLLDALEARVDGEPTEEDQVALLRELGRPEEVAASYRPSDRYLIGPELYPTFKLVLGIVLAVMASLFVLAFGVNLFLARAGDASELGQRLFGLLDGVFGSVITAAGIVVLVFALLQRFEVKPDESKSPWNPRDLPVVKDHDLVSRGGAIAGIVFPAIFLALLNVFRDRIGFVVSPGTEPLLNDVFRHFLPWMSLALFLGMALQTILLWRGRWQWTTRMADFAIDLFGVWVLYRIAVEVAASRTVLEQAGLPDPLPAMVIRFCWGIVAVVGFFAVTDALKSVYRAITGGSTGSDPEPEEGRTP